MIDVTIWKEVSGGKKALSCPTESSLNSYGVRSPQAQAAISIYSGQQRAKAPDRTKHQMV